MDEQQGASSQTAFGPDATAPFDPERLLDGLLETMEECLLVLDSGGSVVYGSPAAARLFGISRELLEQSGYQSPELVVYRLDGSQMPREETASYRAMAAKCVVRDVRMGVRRSDGRVFWLRTSASPLLSPDGTLEGAIVLFTDVTEQVLADQASRQSEERFQTLFKTSPVPTYLWRRDGPDLRLETCNDAAVDNTRGAILGFLGQSAAELVRIDQPPILELLERCLTERSYFTQEIRYRFRDGEERLYDAQFTFVPPDLVLVHTDDVTDRWRAHEAARQSREALTRAHGLLLALSQAAQAVQRAPTPEAVYQTIGDELEQLGYHVVVLTLAPDRQTMTVTHVSIQSRLLRAAEKLAGLNTTQIRIPLAPDGFFADVLARGESVYCSRTTDLVGRGFPRLGRVLAERLIGMLGMEQMAFSPMLDGDERHLLAIAGDDLSEDDVPAVNAFAGQATIALHNARLLLRQRELAQQLVTVQEEERRRLAHVLHDQAGQSLTAMRLRLELIAEQLPAELKSLRERLAEVAGGTQALMDQLRRVAHDLHPPVLEAVGLVPALEGLCRSLSEFSHLSISFEAAEVPGLPDAVRVTLYRFLQEALTNVAKHSGASRVHVKLEKDGDAVALSVQDDGQGIDPEVARRHPGGANGLGIPSIRERLEGLGGRLRLESQPGQGTRLVAQIPVAEPG